MQHSSQTTAVWERSKLFFCFLQHWAPSCDVGSIACVVAGGDKMVRPPDDQSLKVAGSQVVGGERAGSGGERRRR